MNLKFITRTFEEYTIFLSLAMVKTAVIGCHPSNLFFLKFILSFPLWKMLSLFLHLQRIQLSCPVAIVEGRDSLVWIFLRKLIN